MLKQENRFKPDQSNKENAKETLKDYGKKATTLTATYADDIERKRARGVLEKEGRANQSSQLAEQAGQANSKWEQFRALKLPPIGDIARQSIEFVKATFPTAFFLKRKGASAELVALVQKREQSRLEGRGEEGNAA